MRNYERLFGDNRFLTDLRKNGIFTLAFLGRASCSARLAILLDRKIKGESLFRNVFLFPMASPSWSPHIWRWVFLTSPRVGDRPQPGAARRHRAAVWQMSG